MINEQELNKKLAEWAGFEFLSHLHAWNLRQTDGLLDLHEELPNFPESLDACFKWLVPEANRRYGIIRIEFAYFWEKTGCNIITDKENVTAQITLDKLGGEPKEALALCKAIEKLINIEKGVIKANKKD